MTKISDLVSAEFKAMAIGNELVIERVTNYLVCNQKLTKQINDLFVFNDEGTTQGDVERLLALIPASNDDEAKKCLADAHHELGKIVEADCKYRCEAKPAKEDLLELSLIVAEQNKKIASLNQSVASLTIALERLSNAGHGPREQPRGSTPFW